MDGKAHRLSASNLWHLGEREPLSLRALGRWLIAWISVLILALPSAANERELDEGPPPSSAEEILTPIQSVFPEIKKRPSLFPGLRKRLRVLPAFLADTQLEARFRTYYLRQKRGMDVLSEAWAIGGSLYYRSGWLADVFAIELEGFTSQPVYAPEDRGGTGLLAPVQGGYSALGIANARLRYRGIDLTGFRQYLDLPYLNRNDVRMTPNTFESITLSKPEGSLTFSTGYTWRVKRGTSEEFVSMTEAIGLEVDRGLVHAGAVWDPTENLHLGSVAGVVPDVLGGIYGETGFVHRLIGNWETRVDTQFSYQFAVGDKLLGSALPDAWNFGFRSSSSWKGAVLRLGASITPILSLASFASKRRQLVLSHLSVFLPSLILFSISALPL